jgi:hypothetical protein
MADNNYGYWAWGPDRCALQGGASTVVETPDGRKITQKYKGNPAVVPDKYILDALTRSPQARSDFTRLFPQLDPVSQERLTLLVNRNKTRAGLRVSPQTLNDGIQRKEIRAGVHVRAGGRPGIVAEK